ncbi:serine hydrolase domain-containing protein [Mesorhizobium sp. NPDC059054]|uniref:serine hydrolase domain-containing protein n=1 Tax=Mesorhizobium sp. NPDC059054 TaxID=3346711 RepID=UPI003688DA1C
MSARYMAAAEQFQPGDFTAIDEAIDLALLERRIVGAVVLVAKDGTLIYQRAAGLANRETRRLMTVETPFRFASLSKLFTTMAALKLLEAGALSADDLVSRWLPCFAPRTEEGNLAGITVGHLMSHVAGLDYAFQQPADGPYHVMGISDGLDEATLSLDQNLRRIASVPLDRAPGVTWRYSVATDVLGAVVSAAAGAPLPQAMDRLVLRPLKLRASFHWGGDDLAVPYRDGEHGPLLVDTIVDVPLPGIPGAGMRFDPHRIYRREAFPSGGAGMAGLAMDMLRLLEAYRDGMFLSSALRHAARQERVGPEAKTQGPGWGFGWMGSVLIDPASAQSPLSKGSVSWGGVYGHMWAIDFERSLSVIALTNTAFEGMLGQFPKHIIAAATQLDPR